MITASNWRSKAQYLKLKSPHADVTVRDLEGVEETIVIAAAAASSAIKKARAFTRGRVWVNGFSDGREWPIYGAA
jgi:hypothetical protein